MYFKITNHDERHWGMQYQDGLNIDIVPFNPHGQCQPGGIYFSNEENILRYCNYADEDGWIREVTLPSDAQIYHEEYKSKADKVILGKRRPLWNVNTFKWLVKNNVNVHVGGEWALQYATRCGHLSIVRFLIKNGSNIHAYDDSVLRDAARCGHLSIVKLLIKNGADVHINGDQALRWAKYNDHTNVVKYLESLN